MRAGSGAATAAARVPGPTVQAGPAAQPGIAVLTATRGPLLLAVPVAKVGRATAIRASARIPGTPAWFAGMASADRLSLWLLDAQGAAAAPSSHALLAAGDDPQWGLAIDRVETMSEARPATLGAPLPLPAGWCVPCQLSDGRAALLVDPDAIQRALVGGTGVGSGTGTGAFLSTGSAA